MPEKCSQLLVKYLQNIFSFHYIYEQYSYFSIAAVFPAIFIIAASYAGCDRIVVVAMFTLAMGFMGTYYPGMKVNPLDLSPNYAGTIMAITNGIGACTGIAVPYIVGVMTPNVSVENRKI